MKIIYNEEEAKRKKEEIDKRNEKNEREVERKNKRILLISLIISAILISPFTLVAFGALGTCADVGGNIIAGLCGVLCSCIPVGIGLLMQESFDREDYPKDVVYFNTTNGRNVIKHCIEKEASSPSMYAWLEDCDGNVNRVIICCLTKVYNTRVSEETIDLPSGTFLVPYVTKNSREADVEKEATKNEN